MLKTVNGGYLIKMGGWWWENLAQTFLHTKVPFWGRGG